MRNYNFFIKGVQHNEPTQEKRPYSGGEEIKAFNFNHALSHVFNMAKEKKVRITELTIKENV